MKVIIVSLTMRREAATPVAVDRERLLAAGAVQSSIVQYSTVHYSLV